MENEQRKYNFVLIGLSILVAVVLGLIVYFLFFSGPSSSKPPTEPPLAVDNSWQNVQGSGVLRVGTSADYPPFEYYDSVSYQLDGFDVAMMREIGQRLGVQVEFEDIIFDALGEALLVGQVDTAVSAIAITDERSQKMDFSDVYFVSENAFLAQNGTDFAVTTPQDVAVRRVGVQRATVFEKWIRDTLISTGGMPEANLFVYEEATDAVRDLNQGRLDLAMLDLAPAQDAVGQGLGRIAGQGLYPQRMAMAVPKGSEALRTQLNTALQGMYNDGRIHALAQQYLGVPPDQLVPTPPSQATAVITPQPTPTCVDSMQFVADVNLDDQNMTNPPQMPPGAPFTKIWRIRNSGTCTWDGSYSLNYVTGNVPAAQMGGQPTQIAGLIPPGAVYDIAVNLVSPIVPGTYQGFWAMHNPAGLQFGQRIWVGIEVPGPPTVTPLPTQTVNPSINFYVNKTQIRAGECVTFSWRVYGASQVYFYDEGDVWQNYPVPAQVSSRLECPPVSTTYELRVLWPNGGTEIRPQPIAVAPVPNAPVITSFVLTPPYQITLGQCVALSWTVTGDVTSVKLSSNGVVLWDGAPSTGTFQNCPTSLGQVGYSLEATGPGGQSRHQEYIQVVTGTAVPTLTPIATNLPTAVPTTSATGTPNPPTIDSFKAMPQEIREGECVQVSWRVSGNATVVRIYRNNVIVGDHVGLNGSVRDCLTTAGVVLYRIEASNATGTMATADASVTVKPATAPSLPLRNTNWTLTYYYDGVGALVAVLPGTSVTALFGDNNSVTGSGGCNTYSAAYQVGEQTLTVGTLSLTNAVCSQPAGIMPQESAYTSILRTAATYRIVGDTLEVKNGAGVIILRYQGT